MAFAYKGTFTVTSNSSLLPSTQSNFPVLVSVTDNSLKSTGNGGQVTDATADDVNFFSDSSLTSLLSWEIERWNSSTGELIAWVKIPSLALGTVFYAGIGDSSVTTFQGGSVGAAWDSDFRLVAHYPNGSSLTLLDSTSNANDGTGINTPTAGTGKVDGCASLASASTQYIHHGPNLNLTESTITAWVNATTLSAAYNAVITRINGGNYTIYVKSNGKLSVGMNNAGGSAFYDGTGSNTLSTSTWYHIGFTFTVAGGIIGYFNGDSDGTSSTTSGTAQGSTNTRIGSDEATGGREWDGLIDEVRLSQISRSGDWITAEYNSTNDPATFVGSSFAVNGGDSGVRLRIIRSNSGLR